jgi:pheromone shutdown protein TraB
MQAEIYNIDYNKLVHILGTTHFSKRSLYDGHRAVAQLNPTDLAIELDWKRYQALKNQCAACPYNARCTRKCEFIGAVEALENTDVNVWLIDMSRREFIERLRRAPWMSSHWRVLLGERNTLMAARLAWITSESLEKGEKPCVLAMVGAAHVKGIRSLLRNPASVKENLRLFGLSFTPPALIRHIGISGD